MGDVLGVLPVSQVTSLGRVGGAFGRVAGEDGCPGGEFFSGPLTRQRCEQVASR